MVTSCDVRKAFNGTKPMGIQRGADEVGTRVSLVTTGRTLENSVLMDETLKSPSQGVCSTTATPVTKDSNNMDVVTR